MKSLKIIVPLLIFAAALRILGAGSYPVWTDEGWSIWASSDPAQVISIVAADRHPPLYFAALSLWRSAVGDTPVALRFLSIAAGMILVAVVYRLAADVFGRRAGIYAALLIAVLPIAVYYAQEVRHYGWLALFSALSWLIFLRYLRRPSRGLWIGYLLCITAMLYTLYFGLFTLAAQGVILILLPLAAQWRGGWGVRFRTMIGAWIAAAILYLPWVDVILTQQASLLASGISNAPGTLTPENSLPILQLVFSAQIAVPLLTFALGTIAILRRPSLQRIALLLGGAGLFAGMFLLSIRFDFLAARTLLMVTPLLMVVCGAGLSWIDEGMSRFSPLSAQWFTGRHFLWIVVPERRFSVGSESPSGDFPTERLAGGFEPPAANPVHSLKLSSAETQWRGVGGEVRVGILLIALWLFPTLALPQIVQPRLDSDTAGRSISTAYRYGDVIVLETGWDDNAFAYEIAQALPHGAEIVRTLPWTNDRTGGAPVVPQIEPILQRSSRVWVVQWLQAPQVLPFLQAGGDGFQAAQTLDVSAGEYGARFSAPTIQIRLFTRKND